MTNTLIITYPHRRDNNGNPITRIRFVRSTAEPLLKPKTFNAWIQRIYKLNKLIKYER